ncbi:MAG: CDP-archaeol synthase [Clostridia bacterium]|nr:CDP-archaeol synthase [Clostridia bacterium]
MKKRLLTALVGVSIAVGWLCCIGTPAFAIILAVVAGIAAFEMMKVFGITNKLFFVLGEVTAVGIVLLADYQKYLRLPVYALWAVAVLLGLIIMVTDYKDLKFEQVACALMSVILIPAALSVAVYIRNFNDLLPGLSQTKANNSVFLILFTFFCAWLTDGFALFTGMAFGKHKLAPVISPKKTIEGAVGGVLGNCLSCVILWYIFHANFSISPYFNVVWVICSALGLSVVSIFGDLAASTIKRHAGIKDFGNLLPGHGGIMDRFDSSVFVFAAFWAEMLIMDRVLFPGG